MKPGVGEHNMDAKEDPINAAWQKTMKFENLEWTAFRARWGVVAEVVDHCCERAALGATFVVQDILPENPKARLQWGQDLTDQKYARAMIARLSGWDVSPAVGDTIVLGRATAGPDAEAPSQWARVKEVLEHFLDPESAEGDFGGFQRVNADVEDQHTYVPVVAPMEWAKNIADRNYVLGKMRRTLHRYVVLVDDARARAQQALHLHIRMFAPGSRRDRWYCVRCTATNPREGHKCQFCEYNNFLKCPLGHWNVSKIVYCGHLGCDALPRRAAPSR